jgi:curved DNA-binding protein CbpA
MFESSFEDSTTFYDVLNIPPSATPHDVREAYLRAKSAYNKDSVALYSLIDSVEREATLRLIEEAYEILSNELRRREYDAHHGIIENTGTMTTEEKPEKPPARVVSIDRVPPMESLSSDENPLVAPSTDIPSEVTRNPLPSNVTTGATEPRRQALDSDIEREILGETEWRGTFIRRVREAQGVSLEEMSNITKVSKTYLNAIETEDYKKLPALVFVRGFLTQICRVLRLPHEKILDAYLRRFQAAKSN